MPGGPDEERDLIAGFAQLLAMVARDLVRLRLLHQQLARPLGRTPAAVVSALGAMQAQDYLGALWAIGLRLPGAGEAEVRQAVASRRILRTWPLRGTLHFVAAADARWMVELLAPRMIAASARRARELELDAPAFATGRALVLRALRGDRQATREDLYAVLQRGRVAPAGQRGHHLLWRLAQEGIICFAAHRGKQPTFALLDEWAPGAKPRERGSALAELAHRYFTGHGPAAVEDFVWWSGLKPADARAGLEACAPRLEKTTIGGKVYWMRRDAPAPPEFPPATHLLPGFDEYLLGYRDRSAVLDPLHAGRIIPGGNGLFLGTIVRAGRVVGTWKRTLGQGAVAVAATFFVSPKPAEWRAFKIGAERYGRFLDLPVRLIP